MKESKKIIDSEHIAQYEREAGVPFIDGPTGLFSHGFFQISLEREIKRSQRYGSSFTLALIDIDLFSSFNRLQGYQYGDKMLKKLGDLILENIRETDLAARYSGDVISVIMVNSKTESGMDAMERIRQAFEATYIGKSTISVGLACYPEDATDRENLIIKAQKALSTAKAKGKNKIQFFEPQEQAAFEDLPRILVVDDEPKNVKLLDALLKTQGYEVALAYSGEEALSIVNRVDIDLVLLDIMMPEMDGYEVCRRLKQGEETRLIPIVLVTALDDIDSKIKGIEAGADDFISKPPNKVELLTRVKTLLNVKMLNNNLTSIENVLFSLANVVEAKDSYTQGHIERVASLARALGKRMGLSKKEIHALRLGGILHDIGKLAVPESILNKPGPLDPEEWEIMKEHSNVGYNISLPLKKNLGRALDIIKNHHEKLDGSGYPDGLKGDELSMSSRIMAVVDIYDALITNRPYRKGMRKEKAFEILTNEAEEGKLDKKVVEALIKSVS